MTWSRTSADSGAAFSETSKPAQARQAFSRALRKVPFRDRLLGAASLAVFGFACLQIALFGFGRDQGIYAQVAHQLLQGALPYRDSWDFKPPGVFLFYAAAEAWFGQSMLAPRMLELALLVLGALAQVRLGWLCSASLLPGLLSLGLGALVHAELEFWHTAQPETFGGSLMLLALWAIFEGGSRALLGYAGLAGLILGVACLLKPTFVFALIIAAVYLFHQSRATAKSARRALAPGAVLFAFAALPSALAAYWLWRNGGWPAFRWTFFEFMPGYTKLGWTDASVLANVYYATKKAVFDFSAVAATGLCATLLLQPIHGRERELTWLALGIVSTQVVGVVMQAKFFPYHFGGALPVLCLVAGIGLYKLWRRLAPKPGGAVACAVGLCALVSMQVAVHDVPGSFWERSLARTGHALNLGPQTSREALDASLYRSADYSLAGDIRVAYYLRERSNASETVFIWGFEPLIYWLADRQPASRFIYNAAQRAPWQRDVARKFLMSELGARLPEWLIVQEHDIFPHVTGDYLDSKAALQDFSELRELIDRHYYRYALIEDFELYRFQPTLEVFAGQH